MNGRLFYRLRLAANAQATMRLYIAGGYPSRSKAEEALAHHASGRSAALFEPRYGAPAVVGLSMAPSLGAGVPNAGPNSMFT